MADPKIPESLDARISRLQQQIDELQDQLKQAVDFRALAAVHKDQYEVVPIGKATAQLHKTLPRPKKRISRQTQVLAACRDILSDGTPRTTRELLMELASRGIPSKARDPRANLASLMSHSGQFVADKQAGWTVRGLAAPKTKAGNASTSPAFPSNGASQGRLPVAGLLP